MTRPLRIQYEGAVYHVTARGNDRRSIFRDAGDRRLFLHVLAEVNGKFHWFCHAYCLMGNHYHLVIETPDGNLSQGMRQLNGVYTQSYNRRHGRTGHLFQGRYQGILVEKETHLLEVCRYVVLNPVRAKLVRHPEEWEWSSYLATAGKEKPHRCLSTQWVLERFGSSLKEAAIRYRQFIEEGIGETIWDKVRAQSILGREDFVESLVGYVKGRRNIEELPKRQRHVARPDLREIFSATAMSNKAERNKTILRAHEKQGYSQKEIADWLGIHYSTISKLLKKTRE